MTAWATRAGSAASTSPRPAPPGASAGCAPTSPPAPRRNQPQRAKRQERKVMAKIGFIGLGILGAPLAGHLPGGGHEVTSCVNSTPEPGEQKKKGRNLAINPKPSH